MMEKYYGCVSVGYGHIVGLKTDGTVVAVGNNCFGQCNVNGWLDIAMVSAGNSNNGNVYNTNVVECFTAYI